MTEPIHGVLYILERLPNSYFGNPQYLLEVDGHQLKTEPDSSFAYVIPNLKEKHVTGTRTKNFLLDADLT